jgi:DtxR family Mn-dependent transcriptional regulator
MDLVAYEPYQGVVLTQTGRKIALDVIRHHRLIELFLTETLDVPWDQVHAEAHKIEHVLSQDLLDRIDAAGAPIPTREGTIDRPLSQRLTDLQPGQSAVITEVFDNDPALLRYLGELGLYPRVAVRVVGVGPFDGPVTVRVGETDHALGREAASQILVSEVHIQER